MAEQPLGVGVVQAVALARHALHDAGGLQPRDVAVALVLPAHVGLQHRPGALRHPGDRHVEHLLLLRHVGRLGYRPRRDLAAAEVVRRGEVGLPERAPELGDVGAHLPPRPVGGEVAAERALEGLADRTPVRVVPVVAGLAAYAAPQPHLAHHLERGLVRDARAALGAQAYRDLRCPHPFGVLENISLAAPHSSGLVGLLGWASA